MSDNIDVTPGTGKTIAADDVGGVLHQLVKIAFGADGAVTRVTSVAQLPVDGSGVTQPISAAALPLPSGAASASNQGTIISDLGSIITLLSGTLTVSGAITFASPQHIIADSGTITTVSAVTAITNALPAGTNVIGHVIVDSGSVVAASGPTASGATLTANPLTSGGRAATTLPTPVSDGQVVNTMHDKLGRMVSVDAIRTNKFTQKATLSNTTSETTIVTAEASTFHDLYGLVLANTGATTTKVDIRDDTGGAIIATFEVPTLETRGFMVSASSGIPQTAVNKNWTAQCAAATTALEVTALYVKNT